MRVTGRFGRFWLAAGTSSLGNGVRLTALPLIAASLDPSPLFVATVAACTTLPWLVLGLPAGVVVDRVSRGRLVVATHVVRGAAGLLVASAVAGGRLTPAGLIGFALLLGVGDVFADLGTHAMLPSVVPGEQFETANGRLLAAESVAYELVGPALGGVLFAASRGLPVAVDAATFLLAAVLLLPWARRDPLDPYAPKGLSTGPLGERVTRRSLARQLFRELREGVRWFVRARFVRALSVLAAVVNLGLGGLYAVLVVVSTRTLGLGPAGYGWLLAAGAVGGILAGLAIGRTRTAIDRNLLLGFTPPVVAGCLVVTAVSTRVVPVAVALAVIGVVVTWFNAVAMARRQELVPTRLLGRVFSVHRVLCWGALPLGALLAGWVADRTDARTGILACAAVVVLGWLAALPELVRSRTLLVGQAAP